MLPPRPMAPLLRQRREMARLEARWPEVGGPSAAVVLAIGRGVRPSGPRQDGRLRVAASPSRRSPPRAVADDLRAWALCEVSEVRRSLKLPEYLARREAVRGLKRAASSAANPRRRARL